MREILFRGKRIDNGEWVCGYLHIKYFQELPHDRFVIEYEPKHNSEMWQPKYMVAEIYPETVGQFTGMTDKNGKKIFEGDIIQYSIEEDHAVFVGDVRFGEFNPDGGALLNTNVGFYVELVEQDGSRTYMRKDIGFWVKFRQVEVIGNIHDNPEIVKE